MWSSAWGCCPAPLSADRDRGGNRPPRARSGEAVARHRVRCAVEADRCARAGGGRASHAADRHHAHHGGCDATSAVPPRWRDRRWRSAELDVAGPGRAGARMGARGSRRAGSRRARRVLCAGRAGPGRGPALHAEENVYRTINEAHRKYFAAMDVRVGSVGIAASRRSKLLKTLAEYHSALDLPIVRVLADADASSISAVTHAAAP